MRRNIYFSVGVAALAAVIVAAVLVQSFNQNSSITQSTTGSKVVNTPVASVDTVAKSETSVVSAQSLTISSTTATGSTDSATAKFIIPSLMQDAFAISSSQNSVSSASWAISSFNHRGAVTNSSNGAAYFADCANGIARLVPSSNTITQWPVPKSGTYSNCPRGITIDSSSNVYFTENALLPPSNFGSFNSGDGSIGRLVPGTNVITFWQVPTANPILGKLATDSSGNVYFTEGNNTHSKIGRLSPATNTITEWTLPTANSGPYGLVVNGSGVVFFTETGISKIGRLVPSTNVITEWPISTITGNPEVASLDLTTGDMYFTEPSARQIGRLDASTNIISEWTLPGSIVPSDIAVDSSGNVFFSVFGPTVGRLVPTTSTITQWTIGNNPQTVAVDNSGNVFAGTSAGITRLS